MLLRMSDKATMFECRLLHCCREDNSKKTSRHMFDKVVCSERVVAHETLHLGTSLQPHRPFEGNLRYIESQGSLSYSEFLASLGYIMRPV